MACVFFWRGPSSCATAGPGTVEKPAQALIIPCMKVFGIELTVRASVLAATLSFLPAVAVCEDNYPQAPLEPSRPWAPVLYAIVFLAAVCVVAFKHARRTHLD